MTDRHDDAARDLVWRAHHSDPELADLDIRAGLADVLARSGQQAPNRTHIEGLGVAGMSKTATIGGGVTDSNQRKSGPLEKTWMERHQVRTDCKCDTVVKKGFVTYVCTKCGKEI